MGSLLYFYKYGMPLLKKATSWVWVRVRAKCIVYITQYKASREVKGSEFISSVDIYQPYQIVESVARRNWEKRQVR